MKEIHEYRNFMAREELHKSLNALIGLLEGVSSDGIITLDEVAEIQNWHDLHRSLIGRHPFNEISPAIDKALEDGVIDMEELQDILWPVSCVVLSIEKQDPDASKTGIHEGDVLTVHYKTYNPEATAEEFEILVGKQSEEIDRIMRN